jgi:hypothetical protein
MKSGQLVSGGMACRKNYLYGRFEFRVRAEADPSQAVSAVVLTWPENGNWPADGELDIFETTLVASRNPFYTYIHYGANNSQLYYAHNADAKEWQTMMCEWMPDKLTVYRNGTEVWSTTNAAAIPQVAHHLCIQLDAFKTSMTGTVKMYVDWVKIYQQSNTGISSVQTSQSYYSNVNRQLYAGNISGKLTITNAFGCVLLCREVAAGDTVDLSNLDNGIYIVSLPGQTFKIIK